VAFSYKGRGLCPSCGAKRAAELAAFLVDEVVEDVGHDQWVFTIPKMLRVYVLHHRELLGKLSQGAAETARELLAAAAMEEKGFRPGVVPSSFPWSAHRHVPLGNPDASHVDVAELQAENRLAVHTRFQPHLRHPPQTLAPRVATRRISVIVVTCRYKLRVPAHRTSKVAAFFNNVGGAGLKDSAAGAG
jgi:hypothetical protein